MALRSLGRRSLSSLMAFMSSFWVCTRADWLLLQPEVEGGSCSELVDNRLYANELLGGERLWEFELWKKNLVEAKGGEPEKPHQGTFLGFFLFITTSCCSPWSPASCPSLCRWTSCGSCAWTRARASRSPSRRSRSHWRPRPCRPSWAPSGLQMKTRIQTLCWGTTHLQIRRPVAGWRHHCHAGRGRRRSQSSTASARLPGSHFSPRP